MNYIEGCEKVGKFFRFHEKIQFNQDSIEKLPVSEKLTEAVNGSDLPVYGAYEIKIWNEGKNLNKRNYHRVIDQVIKENKVTLGFVSVDISSSGASPSPCSSSLSCSSFLALIISNHFSIYIPSIGR